MKFTETGTDIDLRFTGGTGHVSRYMGRSDVVCAMENIETSIVERRGA